MTDTANREAWLQGTSDVMDSCRQAPMELEEKEDDNE